jgi:protocatechuate 3,4-dioxygenase beta subunit
MTRGVKIIGSVVDLNNKPVPGVKVSMTLGHYHSALMFSGTTDNEGGFVFERVAPEEYHFTLLAPAFHIKNVDHFYVSSDKKEVRARFVMKRGAVISGWAVDTGGNALCGVIVRTKGRNNFKRSTKTDESGFFSIGGLFDNQKYTVEFIPDHHGYKKIENVRGGASVGEVALFAYGSLKGMVTWTGGPVSGAEIHVRPVNDPAIIYAWDSDADGSFLRESLKPNTYRLKIKAEGFMEYVNDKIIIKEGRLLDIGEIRLKR